MDLILIIQEDSGKFEIIEGGIVVVTGIVRIPDNIENEKTCASFIDRNDIDEEDMSTKDIYKELKLRGYQYTGQFCGLKSASFTGRNGHIIWTDNWVTFMDNMLQMKLLEYDTRSIFVPIRIGKLLIDPKSHLEQIKQYPNDKKHILVQNYKHLDLLISGGIEINDVNFMATTISRRQNARNLVLEEYKFVAHRDLDVMSLQDVIRMSLHIAIECFNMINVKIIEFIEDCDQVMIENLNCLFVNRILDDLPKIQYDIKLVATPERFNDIALPADVSIIESDELTKNKNCLIMIGYGILTKNRNELFEHLLSVIMAKGFLLTFEELDVVYDHSCLDKYGLKIVLEKRTKEKTIILLRKIENIKKSQQIVHINNYEFSWVNKLKSFMNVKHKTTNTRIIVVAEGDIECGLIGLVKCLRNEPGGEMITGVFIQNMDAPTFSLQDSLYMKQLQLDLPINVIRSGNLWGSYKHFLLPLPKPKLVQSAYVCQTMQGDLSSLHWVQNKISLVNNNEKNLIRISYASLNFKDLMIASGKLVNLISIATDRKINSAIGLEFTGFNKSGERIMGLCPHNGFANIHIAEKYLYWIIPDHWTMEDAATVPCVYVTCYYALYLKGKMKKGDKVLIHSGTGGVGQAAIYLALYEGCEVFTTVGSFEKRNFIRKTFPSIPEDHIGNSRDTSFEQMIVRKTRGRGVDIVLNSLAEEKLQASVRCLAKGGRFLEIGKFDIISNTPLDLSVFSKGISFYGILLEYIFLTNSENKIILWNKIADGLKNGAIKPLCRKVFQRDEIETAFRYMAAGKHIGKILIKIHKQNESLDSLILARPRYYCLEDKCYIVLGGLGGFGLELIDWLILRGAKNIVVTSRNGIKNSYQRSRIKLWQSYGVNIQIVTVADTCKYKDCDSLLKFAEEQGPVDAIFNLAVVLKDCIFENQSPLTFEESFVPKAWTTKKMDESSRTRCPQLRHFVVFSSVFCGRGNAGQTNYGMANSVMENICEKRTKEGLHGLAIQWGLIGDVGIVADMQKENEEIVIGGMLQQAISSCLDTLEMFLLQDKPIVSCIIISKKEKVSGAAQNLLEAVTNIMGWKNPNLLPSNISLPELGMDSMMVIEIKQTLERDFDISLTSQYIRTLTIAKLKEMMTNTGERETMNDVMKTKINDLNGLKLSTKKLNNSNLNPDICAKLTRKEEVAANIVFLIPGNDGSASIYKLIKPQIKSLAICLQHDVLNLPGATRSITQSAACLLPIVMKKIKDQKEFLIVGYSFGALIAIELARLLEAEDFLGQLILIDGAPDQIKVLFKYFFYNELQNGAVLRDARLYLESDEEMPILGLNKCGTWEEKVELLTTRLSEKNNVLSAESKKSMFTTIYDHIIAVEDYNISSLPRLKSPITLLKPTLTPIMIAEEDYGLHKVTESTVQIHYVEGTHISIMENDKVVSFINKAL